MAAGAVSLEAMHGMDEPAPEARTVTQDLDARCAEAQET